MKDVIQWGIGLLISLYPISLGLSIFGGSWRGFFRGILFLYALGATLVTGALVVGPMVLPQGGIGTAVLWLFVPVTGVVAGIGWALWAAVGRRASDDKVSKEQAQQMLDQMQEKWQQSRRKKPR